MVRGELLSGEARAFLTENRGAIAFPAHAATSPAVAAEFLKRERSRLSSAAGDVDASGRQDVVLDSGLRVRIYGGAGTGSALPALLFFHGGGWVSGSIEQHDTTCEILAEAGGFIVCNVDYRLAPEHPYPAALDDCHEALQWLHRDVEEFGGDPGRIGVVGGSSGGNLAAALVLRARGTVGTPIAAQVLIYPALDSSLSGCSHRPDVNGEGYFVDHRQMAWYWEQYVAGDSTLLDDPLVSPLRESSQSGLPSTIIVTAEYDLLRDDGAEYHRRLVAAGVRSRRLHYPGQIHGFMGLFGAASEAQDGVRSLANLIRTVMSDDSSDVWWDKP